LNWLALGVLLAAWNASDNEPDRPRRPEALRGYPSVSVRAVRRSGPTYRSFAGSGEDAHRHG
jgi:hypothetical protein